MTLPLIDGQYRFQAANGLSLTMGRDTPIRVIKVDGLRALPPIAATDQKKTAQHGSTPTGPRTYDQRRFVFEIVVEGNEWEDVETIIDEMNGVFGLTGADGELHIKRRTKEERVIFCRANRADYPADYDSWLQFTGGALEFVANDPMLYANRIDTLSVPAPVTSVGRTYNRVYDLLFGGGSNVAVFAENRGYETAWPGLVIKGPVNNPLLYNLTQQKFVKFNIDLAGPDFLEVDFFNHIILLNGESRRNILTTDSEWWGLEPGLTQVYFSGVIENGAVAVLVYRSTWAAA